MGAEPGSVGGEMTRGWNPPNWSTVVGWKEIENSAATSSPTCGSSAPCRHSRLTHAWGLAMRDILDFDVDCCNPPWRSYGSVWSLISTYVSVCWSDFQGGEIVSTQ